MFIYLFILSLLRNVFIQDLVNVMNVDVTKQMYWPGKPSAFTQDSIHNVDIDDNAPCLPPKMLRA